MRTGLTISTVGHLALLVWCFVTLPSTRIESTEALPVDMISDADFSHIMAGTKAAPKADVPRQLVEKVGETRPVKDPTPQVSDKPEILPTADAKPTPPPPKPDPKPDPKPQPKPEPPKPPPPAAETKPAPPQPDAIAEALKRDEAKKKEEAKKREEAKKKEEAKKREEAKKKEEAKKREQEERFSTTSIESRLALLDKRAPQRNAATGSMLNPTASLGSPTGADTTLSASLIDALRSHLIACWDVPVGVRDARDLLVSVHIEFRKDGTLATPPVITNQSAHPLFHIAAESVMRAVRKCEPFNFLPVAKYDAWKEIDFDFDPREMFGG